MVWVPPGIAIAEERQQRLLVRIRKEFPSSGFEIIESPLTEIETHIKDRLERPTPALEPVDACHEDRAEIYLLCLPADRDAARPVRDCLFHEGFEVRLQPTTDEGAGALHTRRLESADAFLVYWGSADEGVARTRTHRVEESQGPPQGQTDSVQSGLSRGSADGRETRFPDARGHSAAGPFVDAGERRSATDARRAPAGETRWHFMSVAIDTALQAPFLGLRYFDEEQSHLFFGREVQVNDLLDKLRRSRLVTVMGSSGSGKSSLVRAGVVPSLKAGFLSDAGPRWRIVKMRPGSSPIANLGRELEKALSVPGLEVTLRRGPLGLIQAVEECRLPARENLLVIVDQFEELFRYQREADHPEAAREEVAAFVKLLLEATNQQECPIYLIVTMRSDYLGNCAQFRDLPERINEGLYLVPRMRRDQLEQAITGPVAVEDATITPRLVQKLLNDTGDDPDQLPCCNMPCCARGTPGSVPRVRWISTTSTPSEA